MALPKIFQWPTPWFWCAILLLVLFSNHNFHFGEGVAQVCSIVIVASIIYAIRARRCEKIKATELRTRFQIGLPRSRAGLRTRRM